MRYPEYLLAAAAIALSFTVSGAEIPAGHVVGWQDGTAEIMTDGHDAPIGRIHANGAVTFTLPVPPDGGQTVAETFSRCRTGGLEVVNGAASVTPTMLYIKTDKGERGMVAADSTEMAAYRLSWGQTELVKGSFMRWLYVDGDAAVTGKCVEKMVTPSGPAEFVTEMNLRFVSGWNLVRTTNLELIHHPDGSAHETHTLHDALQGWPEGASWFLEEK